MLGGPTLMGKSFGHRDISRLLIVAMLTELDKTSNGFGITTIHSTAPCTPTVILIALIDARSLEARRADFGLGPRVISEAN